MTEKTEQELVHDLYFDEVLRFPAADDLEPLVALAVNLNFLSTHTLIRSIL